MNKNILHEIKYNRPIDFENASEMTDKISYTFCIDIQEKIDEEILKKLYQIYKEETNVNEVVIIDKEEFKRFLAKYLPIYKEMR